MLNIHFLKVDCVHFFKKLIVVYLSLVELSDLLIWGTTFRSICFSKDGIQQQQCNNQNEKNRHFWIILIFLLNKNESLCSWYCRQEATLLRLRFLTATCKGCKSSPWGFFRLFGPLISWNCGNFLLAFLSLNPDFFEGSSILPWRLLRWHNKKWALSFIFWE